MSILGNNSLTNSINRTTLRIIRYVGSLPGRVFFHSRSLSEWWIWLSLAALWRFAMLQDEYIHISDVTVYGCAATHTGTRRCVWLASTPRHMPVVARDLAQWHTSSVVTSCPFTKAKSTVSSLLLPGDPPPGLVRPLISLLSVFTSVTARSASFQGISLVLGPRP